eukprot:1138790-Pelagomonas_calceolata.AAC.4
MGTGQRHALLQETCAPIRPKKQMECGRIKLVSPVCAVHAAVVQALCAGAALLARHPASTGDGDSKP